jgi:general secretion pathway protein B
MSILLDALRKSEEQRRLGTTPSIHDGLDSPGPGSDSGNQWIPLTLIALSAIVMIWIGWRQYEPPPAGTLADAAAGADRAVAAEGRSPAPEVGPATDASAAPKRPRAQGRTPVESYADDVRAPQVHPDMPPDMARADDQKTRVSQSFQAYESESEPAGEETAQNEAAVALAAPDVAVEPPPAQRQLADPARTQTGSSRLREAASAPITFWELPQGVRDSMPELRITVLVYAERPEDRFLLMGGQRMVEKDEFEGGVVLEEIRRDGAVFLYRNYRFLVKG